MLEAKKNNQNNETYATQNNYLESIEMKNVILRPDGRYMARKQINGKRINAYAKTEKQSLEKLKQKIKNINNIKKEKNIYKLHEWLDNWYLTYKEPFIKLNTAQKLKNILNKIKNNFDNLNLEQITTQKIQQYLNKIKTTRTKEFIVLYFNACLQKAEDLNIINKNPFKSVVKDKKLNIIRQGYNLQEQQHILNALKGNKIEGIILFYLITGIRKNELETINLETDLDIKNKTIKILSEKKRNNNIYRYIDLTDDAIKLILNNKENFKLKTDYIYRELKKVLDNLNIKSGLHRLRHTFATNHFYLGTPIKLISSWLGHETVELTQNIYTHIDRTITKNDILKLYNNLLFKI